MANIDFKTGTVITADWLNKVDHRLQEHVSITDFRNTGDTNDTNAFIAALATGKSVFVPDGDYVITSALYITGPGQRIIGNSRASRIFPQGSFNVFNFSGSTEGQGIEKLYVDATDMTGGNLINVDSTDRIRFKDLIVWTPWNFAYITKTNNCVFDDVLVNNIKGDYGIKWYGDGAARSDILRLTGVVLSGNSTTRPTGILWDGNCNTLQIQTTSLVNVGYGIRITNTSGGEDPQFLFADDLEIAFSLLDCIRIEAGQHFYFTPSLHLHGSNLGSGIYAYSTIPSDTLVVTGGKITGHNKYGIEMENPAASLAGGNVYFDGNGLGNVSGVFLSKSERFTVDDRNWLGKDPSGNPVLAFDVNDFLYYDRSEDTLQFFQDGVVGVGHRLSAGNPILNFDNHDYLVYSRHSNTYGFVINEATHLLIGSALGNYANDAAAAAGGIPRYGYYRNGSIVMQRVV